MNNTAYKPGVKSHLLDRGTASPGAPEGAKRSKRSQRSALRFQLRLVGGNEVPDFVRHIQKLEPLLLIQRDGEPTETVDRHASFLAHLERNTPHRALLERLVLGAQALQLGPEIRLRHAFLCR